jgi:hypothetical protein
MAMAWDDELNQTLSRTFGAVPVCVGTTIGLYRGV